MNIQEHHMPGSLKEIQNFSTRNTLFIDVAQNYIKFRMKYDVASLYEGQCKNIHSYHPI